MGVLKRTIEAAHSWNRELVIVFIVWWVIDFFFDVAEMCFDSASFSLFNLVKIDKPEVVSLSKGPGQEGNVHTGQIYTKSNDEECVPLPNLSLSRTHTEITLKEIHSKLT